MPYGVLSTGKHNIDDTLPDESMAYLHFDPDEEEDMATAEAVFNA